MFFDETARQAFCEADAKEWPSFLETGTIEVIPPKEASTMPSYRIFSIPMRTVHTDNNNEDNRVLEATARLVTPGDVDVDGETPVADGVSVPTPLLVPSWHSL